MSKWLQSRVLWGVLLIVAGVIFLLQNLFSFELSGIFWGVVFALAGLLFLVVFLSDRMHWWSLIPGFTLLGIAATIISDSYLPTISSIFGGAFILGGIGVAFSAVYLSDSRNWWALIPAGVMFTLTTIIFLDNAMGGFGSAGVLFFGLGLTFLVLALIRTPENRLTWAWYPAIILLVIGVIISAAAEQLFGYVWPVALILGGIVLIYRTFRSR